MSINIKEAAPPDSLTSLYERDYYGWIERNVHAIREGRVHEVDWANVAEELEDMGKSERRALRSQLARLMSHLLKWSYQPERRRISEHSWRATIEHARQSVSELLNESPSFKPQLSQLLLQAYRDAVAEAVAQTNLPKRTFPIDCPWTFNQMMAEDFWPEQ
jgi:DNA primase